jgi:transcriptional regulator with GAF, ATPase, and Fis domain
VFDCTAVPASLIEAELFGHEKGAFTGALTSHRGVFEQANTGTLLIDEIGDLELPLQAKLLRAIERGEVKRLGGEQVVKCDVRIICATRRDLDKEVQAGRFRDDLYFRLAVARIELPPLRDRTGDIGLLIRHFWRQLGSGEPTPMPPNFVERAEAYSWPGNVRELRNLVARTLALGDLADQGASPRQGDASSEGDPIEEILELGLSFPAARDRVQHEFERRFVERLLTIHGGNVARAAAASGVARRYFQLIRARVSGKAAAR